MATSGQTQLGYTRDAIITAAYRKAGAYQSVQGLTSDQLSAATANLNMLIKDLQAEGAVLWKMQEIIVPLTANKSVYTFGLSGADFTRAVPLQIVQAIRHDSTSNTDVDLLSWSRQDYISQTNKGSTGTPVAFYYEEDRAFGTLYIWLTPDDYNAANVTLKLQAQVQTEVMAASGNEFDFPEEWFMTLTYLLADEIALEEGTPQATRATIYSKAMAYRDKLVSWSMKEGPTVVRFARDYRGG